MTAAATDSRPSEAASAGSIDLSESELSPAGPLTSVVAVVFDLGNVLITWDPFPAIAKAVGAEQATRFLADQDFDFMAWNHEQDAGRSWDEGEAVAVTSHPHWESAILAYRSNYQDTLVGAIEDTVQILRELHAAGIPLYALTNWSDELFPAARRRFDFLDLFEDIVVSGKEGVAKPDARIFTILQERIGHPLNACIFVDDSQRNVAAAAKAGLDAILFTDTGHLRKDLRLRNLPLSPA
jgi:2-haloacid dehalogenase